MTQSARSAVFIGFESLCRQYHLNAHHLLQECGIDPIVLRHQDLLVDYSLVGEALNLAAHRSKNQQFGLQLSQQRDYLVFGPFGLLLSQAENVADLIRITNQFAYLHAPGIQLTVQEKDTDLAISYQLSLNSATDTRQLIELGVGVVFRAARAFFQHTWQPHFVTFAHKAPNDMALYRAVFNAPVLFNQDQSAIYVDKDILQAKPQEQRELIKHHLIKEYSASPQTPLNYIEQSQHVILSVLATGECTLPKVANILGIHPRQLQKIYQQANTTFRRLLDEVRYKEARYQLTHTNVRITDLALSLGYADETAFSRAFKRWSGVPPRVWRETKPH